MERKDFLDNCEELGFWIEKIIDLGSLVHGHDSECSCFREFSEDIHGVNDETLSFLDIGHLEDFEAEDEEDEEALFVEALHLKIHQEKKFGFIATINVPERRYSTGSFSENVGFLRCPTFYAETMEEIYDISVEEVLKIRIDQGYTSKG